MAPKRYGRTIEIDHIVSLELGGSNDPADLFPEPGSGAAKYHVKDTLENKLHDLVCAGTMTSPGSPAADRGELGAASASSESRPPDQSRARSSPDPRG
jgi:hypothetical protein